MTDPADNIAMPTTGTSAGVTSGNDEAILFRWRAHPLKRNWRVSAALILLLLGVMAGTSWYVGSVPIGIFFGLVMLVSLSRFFLPTEYLLDPQGIRVRTLTGEQQRPWSQFRTAYPDKNGVLLSPYAGPTRLENFRGLYLMFENNREDVLRHVREAIARFGADTAKANPVRVPPTGEHA